MKTVSQTVSYPNLKGSERHLPLKNKPGEKGEPNYAEIDDAISEATKETVESSAVNTQIVDAFRALKSDD